MYFDSNYHKIKLSHYYLNWGLRKPYGDFQN